MTAKTKSKSAARPVPQTLNDCATQIAELGRVKRELVVIETEMNAALAEAKEKSEGLAEPFKVRQKGLEASIQDFCEAHRGVLTNRQRKYYKFTTGMIRWRDTPPKVVLAGIKDIIAALKRAKLTSCIRVKESVDKEAVLRHRARAEEIEGVTITQGEQFEIEPFEAKLAEGGE